MALLLFRFSILFTIGLLPINGSFFAVSSFVTQNGSDPKLKFVLEPPVTVIAGVSKSTPVFLPCSVKLTDEDNDEPNDPERDRVIRKYYQKEFYKQLVTSNGADDGNAEDGSPDDDGDDGEPGFRFRRAFNERGKPQSVQYVWYRNDEELISTHQSHDPIQLKQVLLNGFRLFPNGTLKIQYSNFTAGSYRCRATHVRTNDGLLSRESVVKVAVFLRTPNTSTTRTVTLGSPFMLTCPFQSYPPANITWFFNKNQIYFDINYELNRSDNRYFQLQNGSILITEARLSDAGKYRCNASNVYSNKALRSISITVEVSKIEANDPLLIKDTRLFPRLQNETQRIRTGESLVLHCVAFNFGKMEWTFTPRRSTIPIKLSNVGYELKYVNISFEKHDGIYNCSSGIDYQVYDVTVLKRPEFVQNFSSILSPMAVSASLNCNVTGHPMPVIKCYKNGREIINNFLIYYKYPTLRFQSIEPEDEAIYQCFAKNEAGEASVTGQLTVRDNYSDKRIPERLENPKCYPIDYQTILIVFETKEYLKMINYYLASADPMEWIAPRPMTVNDTTKQIIISTDIIPLKEYTIYLRGLVQAGRTNNDNGDDDRQQLLISRLSQGIQCVTQGLHVYNVSLDNGIFLWWFNLAHVEATSFTIQFWHNSSSNLTSFANYVIGTNITIDETMNKINIPGHMFKIPASTYIAPTSSDEEYLGVESSVDSQLLSSKTVTITEVKVAGNVTGILIPNAKRLVVRILAATAANGEPKKQDLRYLHWKTIDWSSESPVAINKLQTVEISSRNVKLSWTATSVEESKNCVLLCYRNQNNEAFIRTGKELECQKINTATGSFELRNLAPFAFYKMYLKICNTTNVISDVVEVITKQDIPGPVTKHHISRDNGITLYWEPPTNPNGKLNYYQIEWKKEEEYSAVNVSENVNSFKFPNITNADHFNVTIKAVGVTGVGLPIYLRIIPPLESEAESEFSDSFMGILVGVSVGVCLIVACMIFLLRHRGCNKNRSNINHNQSFAPAPQLDPPCSTDIHEMQTLITRPELPTLIPNGKVKPIQDNGNDVAHNENERRRNITTDIDDHKEVTPITATNHVAYYTNGRNGKHIVSTDPKMPQEMPPKINGYVKSPSVIVPIAIPISAPLPQPEPHYDQHVNRSSSFNQSPKKPLGTTANLRITENPQFSPDNSTISVFDNSQQKLIDLTIDSNNSIPHMDDDDNNNIDDLKINHKSLNDNSHHLHHQNHHLNHNNHHPQSQTQQQERHNHSPHQHHNHQTNHLHNHLNHNRLRAMDEKNDDDDDDVIGDGQNVKSKHHQHPHNIHNNHDDTVNNSSDDLNYDLNDSNLSSKPLHTNWDFRRPIVGPNG